MRRPLATACLAFLALGPFGLTVGCGGCPPAAAVAPKPESDGGAAEARVSPGSAGGEGEADAAPLPPMHISARHVLIQWIGCDHAPPSVVRSRDQAYAVAEDVLRRARAGEDFARLALEYSDEPNAGQRGGSLGRFGHGQMVKAFEDAAFALKVGEVSGIVQTGFGFHVILRTE